jgi:hypothetical protein
MKTLREDLNEANSTCTALELSKQLDKLRDIHGAVDQAKIEKLINQLQGYGPFYKDILCTIAEGLSAKTEVVIIRK